MPRRKQPRKIVEPPKFKQYKPCGCNNKKQSGNVELLYEEYEALKLADYDLLPHHKACKLMGISRATFARIYESARRKIAKALVETKNIVPIYGNAYFENNWYKCEKCHNTFSIPEPDTNNKCPICKTTEIILINQ